MRPMRRCAIMQIPPTTSPAARAPAPTRHRQREPSAPRTRRGNTRENSVCVCVRWSERSRVTVSVARGRRRC
ncbi:hypothetical protein EYF80_067384 [Liparis tanakae]|uniref:Uncharacterized protein n=1 Tax=Liparis tanakae TaxID=230148 RepID=A0A4Z2E2A1_9TELE|nr:hypothetical protein EYF80_067384 [Liparis tanakae]